MHALYIIAPVKYVTWDNKHGIQKDTSEIMFCICEQGGLLLNCSYLRKSHHYNTYVIGTFKLSWGEKSNPS